MSKNKTKLPLKFCQTKVAYHTDQVLAMSRWYLSNMEDFVQVQLVRLGTLDQGASLPGHYINRTQVRNQTDIYVFMISLGSRSEEMNECYSTDGFVLPDYFTAELPKIVSRNRIIRVVRAQLSTELSDPELEVIRVRAEKLWSGILVANPTTMRTVFNRQRTLTPSFPTEEEFDPTWFDFDIRTKHVRIYSPDQVTDDVIASRECTNGSISATITFPAKEVYERPRVVKAYIHPGYTVLGAVVQSPDLVVERIAEAFATLTREHPEEFNWSRLCINHPGLYHKDDVEIYPPTTFAFEVQTDFQQLIGYLRSPE